MAAWWDGSRVLMTAAMTAFVKAGLSAALWADETVVPLAALWAGSKGALWGLQMVERRAEQSAASMVYARAVLWAA